MKDYEKVILAILIMLALFGTITALVGITRGFPISSSTSTAEMICESHNMRLVSHEGAKEIICEKVPEIGSDRKVFVFED